MTRRRYNTSKKLRKESRTIPVPAGDGHLRGTNYTGILDDGRFFRCWNCGFINAVDRNSLGGSQSRSGLIHKENAIGYPSPNAEGTGTEALSPDGRTPYQLLAVMGGINTSYVALENDPNGTTKPILHSFESAVAGGCAFCGSKNYRGDY